ncbi:hypothetical protein [Sorangium sp. So ce363]|uniref:hypothetical protein n=1 Tax=Sorangium sp. So ce363 TaxID=3133304 RepID=UPI003F645B7A
MEARKTGGSAACGSPRPGFFSKHHHGVFTHIGSNTHFHVVLPERPLMGHVDGVTLARGARVLLPAP